VKKIKYSGTLTHSENKMLKDGSWEKEQKLLSESFTNVNNDALLSFSDPDRFEADESDVETAQNDSENEDGEEDAIFDNSIKLLEEWTDGLEIMANMTTDFVEELSGGDEDKICYVKDLLDATITALELCQARVSAAIDSI